MAADDELIARTLRHLARMLAACVVLMCAAAAVAAQQVRIVLPAQSCYAERLGAAEIRRYMYLRTAVCVPIITSPKAPTGAQVILVARKDRALCGELAGGDAALERAVDSLAAQQFLIRTLGQLGRRKVLVVGGDDAGTLYGAYRFIEHIGVRFYLHGDVVPDERIPLALPEIDESGKPLFELRGLNPWGSHAEGMDLWGVQEYKAIFSQMAKMRMNFLGIHCYSEGHPFAEPLVWTGIKGDFDRDGNVKFAYPASYFNTPRDGCWGYKPKKTGEYGFGAHLLFERDDWGAEIMAECCPWPGDEAGYNLVFNRMGRVLRESFTFARQLGIKTCIGTEAPLVVPARLQQRLRSKGKDPQAPSTIREIYEGMFERITCTHPLDYYWIWTSESWTWRGNSTGQLNRVVSEIEIALKALKNIGSPFGLATAGWVLGPQDDRAAFDRLLPEELALSAISRSTGHDPVDPAFGTVKRRAKWAIPWLEDDPALTSPQLWVGRIRKDAADALAYRCTGLMGLHWRTRILGPNAAALAQACWDQSRWNPAPGRIVEGAFTARPTTDGPTGGRRAYYPAAEIAGTDEDELYRSCRYDTPGYRLRVPDATYQVTLKFCEPHFNAAGKRVWDVQLQGRKVIEKLDIFARAGKFAALDYTFDDVEVADGLLKIDFLYDVSLPCISAIVIEGKGSTPFVRKINCGGAAHKDYESDDFTPTPTTRGKARGLPAEDFYTDWCGTAFGPRIAERAAAIFQGLDGNLPRTSSWVGGAGGIRPDDRPWPKVAAEFSFIDQLEKLRPSVEGPGCLERFDYWLNTFRYHRAQARVRCALARFNAAMKKVEAEKDPATRRDLAGRTGLLAYAELIEAVGEAYRYQLSALTTCGGMATIINWEGHIGPAVVVATGQRLAKALGRALPEQLLPDKTYRGPARIIVPTARTTAAPGESLRLKVIVLANDRPEYAAVYWREMGDGQEYSKKELTHIARAVYSVTLPPLTGDIEYYIKAITAEKDTLYFPAGAPNMNHTVVVVAAD